MKQRRLPLPLLALLSLYFTSTVILAEENGAQWQIHTSAYTQHYHYSPQHNDHQHLINIERYDSNNLLIGAAVFDNSFNQASQYVYAGKIFHPINNLPDFHLKVTGGLIHGYKGAYKDKIPMNNLGVAPAILPSIGYSYRQATSEIIFLGVAGAMLTIGYKF